MKILSKTTVRGNMFDASWVLKIKQVFHRDVVVERFEQEAEKEEYQPRLCIDLENFGFYHKESTSDKIDDKYIQRPRFENKLRNWLTEESGHGIYLVTGYRGAGKSSLVGKVIRDLKKGSKVEKNTLKWNFMFHSKFLRLRDRGKYEETKGKRYVNVGINIGQDNIDEVEFFRVLAKTLREELTKAVSWSKKYRISWYMIFSELKRFRFLLCALYLLSLSFGWRERVALKAYMDGCEFWYIFGWAAIVLAIVFPIVLVVAYVYGKLSKGRAIMHLDRLCEQLYAVTRYKSGLEFGDIFKSVMAKEREVPPVSAQGIAYELVSIIDILKDKFSIIIVLDELDKVDKVEKESAPSNEIAEEKDVFKQAGQYAASQVRRQRVLAMIANMKYFLSTASAYFIFIAGRELYEAAMADISDREFAIGNLFNGILQVDSFYTRNGLSETIVLTEEFVCKQIAGVGNLQELYAVRGNKEQMIFLYHFICYLAFISHGSPKKIAVFFEKYVRKSTGQKADNQNYDQGFGNAEWCLAFNDHQQKKINFVHYLVFPILKNIMDCSAIFGDKLRVAESFIFAHIVKLHNSGFSWRNIEQIPEVMSINRAPEVREYIQSILLNMQQTLIKPVVCGLYAYKFPMRMSEEISYYSKLSDELSALLNFSTGELQPIKEHYYALLDKLPSDAQRETQQDVGTKGVRVYTEASVRHALGDIYMQEENFSAAIRQFERCVELVTPLLIKPAVDAHGQLQNYVLFYYRTMLKLGLAHEKRRTDNSAYAVYGDLLRVLFEVRKNNPQSVAPLFQDNRGLHLGILAQVYVLERMGTTGITCNHIAEAIERFDTLYEFALSAPTQVCNPIVKADFYRKLGDILFYKNFECVNQGYSAIWAYEKGIDILLPERGLSWDRWQKIYGYIVAQHGLSGAECFHGDKMWIYSLAILFESLGHAYVGVSRFADLKSASGQMARLTDMVRGIARVSRLRKGKRKSRRYPRLNVAMKGAFIKGLYCYWVAARLYDMADRNQAMVRSYKQLLSVLELYVKQCFGNKTISVSEEIILNKLLDMADFVIRKMVMVLYRSYEYVNMLEWDWIIKIFGTRELMDKVGNRSGDIGNSARSYLSVYAEIEDAAYAYFRLLIAYCHVDSVKFSAVHSELYRALLQTRKANATAHSTLASLINRYRLVLCIYKYYLSDLLRSQEDTWSTPADISDTVIKDFIDEGFQKMLDFVFSIGGVENLEKFLGIPILGTPHIHSIRKHRRLRNSIFFAYKRYRLALLNKILADAVRRSEEILKWMVGPLQVTTLFNHTFQGNVYNDYAIFLKLYNQLKDYANKKGINDFDNVFKGKKQAPKYANGDYLAERALQSYDKVRECHKQGQAYQDLILQLYFLEDDYNNDTVQFYLATERMALKDTADKARKLHKESKKRANYYWLESYEIPMEEV